MSSVPINTNRFQPQYSYYFKEYTYLEVSLLKVSQAMSAPALIIVWVYTVTYLQITSRYVMRDGGLHTSIKPTWTFDTYHYDSILNTW